MLDLLIFAFFLSGDVVGQPALPTGSVELLSRVVNELYLEPLGVKRAVLSVEVDRFYSDCPPDAFSVRVFRLEGKKSRELFHLDTRVKNDQLVFLVADGAATRMNAVAPPLETISRSIRFLAQTNGWQAIEEVERHPRRHDLLERRMRDPLQREERGTSIRTMTFFKRNGLPRMIGFPFQETGERCDPPPSRFDSKAEDEP